MKRKSWIKNLSIMAMVVCACLGQSRADTLYYDDFSGDSGSPLDGTMPDIGLNAWSSADNYYADGSISNGFKLGSFLPFTPEDGELYELSGTLNCTGTNLPSGWLAVGFTSSLSTSGAISQNGGTGWFLLGQDTGEVQTFLGPNTGGGLGYTGTPGLTDFKTVLDTRSANWTVEWFLAPAGDPLVSIRSGIFGPTPDIKCILLNAYNGEGTINELSLTVYSDPLAAYNPDPMNGVERVLSDLSDRDVAGAVSWLAPTDPTIISIDGYDVYMDTDSNKVATATAAAPGTLYSSVGQFGTSFDPGVDLDPGTYYYWRVDTTVTLAGGSDVTASRVWSFETEVVVPLIETSPLDAAAKIGDSADFTVTYISGAPVVGVTWYKDGSPLAVGGNIAVTFDDTGSTLSIADVQLSDVADYHCVASTSFGGSDPSGTATIILLSDALNFIQITGDADCGITSNNVGTYTHALDFGNGPFATVNGLEFVQDFGTAVVGGPQNSGVRTFGSRSHNGGTPPAVGGDIASVFRDMFYWGSTGYVELTGLTPGTWYDVRFYDRAWGYPADRPYTAGYDVDSDGSVEYTTPPINTDNPTEAPVNLDGNVSWVTSYRYQAGAAGKIKININGGIHLYGLTNQEIDVTPPLDPLVLHFNGYSAGTLGFAWESSPGGIVPVLYTLEHTASIVITNWAAYNDGVTTYENMPADGSGTNTLNVLPNGDVNFFRVKSGYEE
jgi:hypothetical protein